MSPEYAPERIGDLLSVLIEKEVKVMEVLPTESRIADEESLPMYSKELAEMDRNTVHLMIDEYQEELEEIQKQKEQLQGEKEQLQGEEEQLQADNIRKDEVILQLQRDRTIKGNKGIIL